MIITAGVNIIIRSALIAFVFLNVRNRKHALLEYPRYPTSILHVKADKDRGLWTLRREFESRPGLPVLIRPFLET